MGNDLDVAEGLPTARRGCPFDPPKELADIAGRAPISRMAYPDGDGHVGWLVTDWELSREVLAGPAISARHELRRFPVPFPVKLGPAAPGVLVGMDAPEHTRLRRPLAKAFTARQAESLVPVIERLTEEVLDEMAAQGGSADLMQSFALPLPVRITCEVLGGTEEMTYEFIRNRVHLVTPGTPPETVKAAMQRIGEVMHSLVEVKKAEPGDDLMSALIAEGEFDDGELASLALQVLGAGHEPMAAMYGLGTLLLLEKPELWKAFDIEGWAPEAAVDELLRYLSVAQFITRAALEDFELGGEQIKKGDVLTVSVAAANRDASRFQDPDAIDLEREKNAHLTLGHGAHRCLGYHLSRVEMRIAFPALVRRFPKLRVTVPAEQVSLREGMSTYGVHELPVAW